MIENISNNPNLLEKIYCDNAIEEFKFLISNFILTLLKIVSCNNDKMNIFIENMIKIYAKPKPINQSLPIISNTNL